MVFKNLVKIICGLSFVKNEATKLVAKKAGEIINDNVLKENYVTRDEFEILKKHIEILSSKLKI